MVGLFLIPTGMDWHFPAAPSLPTPGAQPGHCFFNVGRAERPDPPSGRASSEPLGSSPPPAGASQPNPEAQHWEPCHWWRRASQPRGGAGPAQVRLVARNYSAALQVLLGVVVLTAQTCRGCGPPSSHSPHHFFPLDFKSHKTRKLTVWIAVYKLNRNRLCGFSLYLLFSRQVIVPVP